MEAIKQTKEMYEQNFREVEINRQEEVNQHKDSLEKTISELQNELQSIQSQWCDAEAELHAGKEQAEQQAADAI